MSILCKMGLHKKRGRNKQKIDESNTVVEIDFSTFCIRCGEVTDPWHMKWNADKNDFEPMNDSN